MVEYEQSNDINTIFCIIYMGQLFHKRRKTKHEILKNYEFKVTKRIYEIYI